MKRIRDKFNKDVFAKYWQRSRGMYDLISDTEDHFYLSKTSWRHWQTILSEKRKYSTNLR